MTASGETFHTAASPAPAPAVAATEKGKVTMKKLLMSVAFIGLVCGAVPADAGSTLAIGGGANLGNVTTLTGAGALGNAAAASAANGVNTSVGSGVAVATPLGSLSAGMARPSVSPPVSPVQRPVRVAAAP